LTGEARPAKLVRGSTLVLTALGLHLRILNGLLLQF